jgi:hypothetical protein
MVIAVCWQQRKCPVASSNTSRPNRERTPVSSQEVTQLEFAAASRPVGHQIAQDCAQMNCPKASLSLRTQGIMLGDGCGESAMAPIYYFMAIFVGACIGLTGEAVYFGLAF